jgi:hypothetical protein
MHQRHSPGMIAEKNLPTTTMPKPPPNSTNSPEILRASISRAQDVGEVWRLIRKWRKRDLDAMGVAMRYTPFWDEGLVRAAANHWYLMQEALKNPSWPEWGADEVMDRAVQVFSGEQGKAPSDVALVIVRQLAAKGLVKCASNEVGEMLSDIGGRQRMPYRQLGAAQAALSIPDLTQEWYNHIIGAMVDANVAVSGYQYSAEGSLMREVLAHRYTTRDVVRRLAAGNARAVALIAALGPKWEEFATGLIAGEHPLPAAGRGPRR